MPHPDGKLRLLALDGGGVRGLSSLMVLDQLMTIINPTSPPKPCDYFDMIGGTSTGGIIAIMLGRLEMSVRECIDIYVNLCRQIFEKPKKSLIGYTLKLQGRYDHKKLEQAVKEVLERRHMDRHALLQDPVNPGSPKCRVFVSAVRGEITAPVCFTNYRPPRSTDMHLFETATIWQACRATSAATTFFDPVTIGDRGETFIDGGLQNNNPVHLLWQEATDVWCSNTETETLESKLQCIVSIGTGVSAFKGVTDGLLNLVTVLRDIATETELTAENFQRNRGHLALDGRYFRFNVTTGLDNIGLEEWKKRSAISSATSRYLGSEDVYRRMLVCTQRVAGTDWVCHEGNWVYTGPPQAPFPIELMGPTEEEEGAVDTAGPVEGSEGFSGSNVDEYWDANTGITEEYDDYTTDPFQEQEDYNTDPFQEHGSHTAGHHSHGFHTDDQSGGHEGHIMHPSADYGFQGHHDADAVGRAW